MTAARNPRITRVVERELTIESLVHGGDGLARDEGRVVFVPLTVPGDRVRVSYDPARTGATHGQLLEVLSDSPSRVIPPCPVVGICGGCQWQQADLAAQQRAKEQNVRDSLIRIGRFADPPVRPLVPSPKPWRYRRRLRAHPMEGGWGFSQRASNQLVPIAACLLVEEEAEEIAHALAKALGETKGFGNVRSFQIDTVATASTAKVKGAAHLELAQAPTDNQKKRAAKLLDAVPNLSGLVLTGPDGASPALIGEPVLIDHEHHRLRIRPDLFAQANRLGARQLAADTAATIVPGASVLELFAGSGTLSLAITERAGSLIATEGDGPALDLLRTSLRDLKRDAKLISGPAARVMKGLAEEGTKFDHIVLDPPRTGAKDVMDPIIRLAPERITYVSCDAPTFARDASVLVQAGWQLESVTPYDMFPHTHHVELLAVLRRS